jgi:hypothetical protein
MWSASSNHEAGLLMAFTAPVISNEWCSICFGTWGWNIIWVLLSRVSIMRQWLLFDYACAQIRQGLSLRNLGTQPMGLELLHHFNFLLRTTHRGLKMLISLIGAREFTFFSSSRLDLGPTQPPLWWVPGAPSLGMKLPQCDANCSFPSITENTNELTVPHIPPYAVIAWTGRFPLRSIL